MPNRELEFDIIRDLLEESAAVGQLAAQDKLFNEAYLAYRKEDREKFQAILKELKLPVRCHLVCEWIRSKECFFHCHRFCGPPNFDQKPPDPRQVAEAVARILVDEKHAREIAGILQKGDVKAFQNFVKTHKLEPYCHVFCHWLCLVRYHLLCRWLCTIGPVERPDLAQEILTAAHAIEALLKHKKAFDQVLAASEAADAEKFAVALRDAGLYHFCRFICIWFCSWRCMWVCLRFCRPFKLPEIKDEVREALEFAKAMQPLVQHPADLLALNAALRAGNSEEFAALLKRLKLDRYCIQLCHWICVLRCRVFCFEGPCGHEGLYPQFTSIGGYDYNADINSAVGGNGLTKVDGRAFFSILRLNGILPQTLGGQPMEYRFETAPTDALGNLAGGWTPVLPGQIARTVIGHWEHFVPLPVPHVQTKKYTVNGAVGPNELVATIAPDGWIKVPQENDFMAPAGAFSSNGDMIELISKSLAPFTSKSEAGVLAGGAPAHPLVQDVYFAIRMRVRSTAVAETDGGTCTHIAVDNTLYDNITLHPDWDGGLQPAGQFAVRMLDIAELIAHPCSLIINNLTVQFTAAHPNLGGVNVHMDGPGGPYAFTLPAAGTGEWFGIATPNGWTVATLTPCAYLITLQVNLLLTDGDNYPDPVYDQIAFCKGGLVPSKSTS